MTVYSALVFMIIAILASGFFFGKKIKKLPMAINIVLGMVSAAISVMMMTYLLCIYILLDGIK